jgi:hypothetical protein
MSDTKYKSSRLQKWKEQLNLIHKRHETRPEFADLEPTDLVDNSTVIISWTDSKGKEHRKRVFKKDVQYAIAPTPSFCQGNK